MSTATAIALVVILAALFLAAWVIIYLVAQKGAVVTKAGAKGTPLDVGLPYEELTIRSGPRALQAWWVRAAAANDTNKAILIYHGNNETIAEWIPALQFLWQHGISSFVFDYSGFGYSTGPGTFRTLREDAIAARRLFEVKAGSRDKYLLGLSLGSGVLLQGHPGLTPGACGMILVAAFTSLRDVALAWRVVPSPLAYLAPHIYDNSQHIRSVRVPVLIVHSRDDDLFPPAMPQELYAAANEPKTLILLDGLKHNDMLEGRHAEYLGPIIEHLRGN